MKKLEPRRRDLVGGSRMPDVSHTPERAEREIGPPGAVAGFSAVTPTELGAILEICSGEVGEPTTRTPHVLVESPGFVGCCHAASAG